MKTFIESTQAQKQKFQKQSLKAKTLKTYWGKFYLEHYQFY